MDIEKVKADYEIYKTFYEELQKEVFEFLQDLQQRTTSVDIAVIVQRPKDRIKDVNSIIKNINERPDKYKGIDNFVDINDIAGVRVTCHCQSDREVLFDILLGELKQKYDNVVGDKKNNGIYRAYHFNFSKKYNILEEKKDLYCEVQLRTILGDAWAVQDSKYVYKNKNGEGEPQILSHTISAILNSCESLWDLVKAKSGEQNEQISVGTLNPIFEIQKEAEQKVSTVRQEVKRTIQSLDPWFSPHKFQAYNSLVNLGITGFMQIEMYLPYTDVRNTVTKPELKEIARDSQIHTFGWPIAIYVDRDDYRPKPDQDGIVAEISIKDAVVAEDENTYDYWTLKMDGSFYFLGSLFEDHRKPSYLFFNTRVVRIAEALMYASNIYTRLGIGKDELISIKITHGGLKGRIMGATGNRMIHYERKSIQDEVPTEIQTSLKEIEEHLSDVVCKFTTPLFEMFDFFTVEKRIIDDIVEKYKNGVVS